MPDADCASGRALAERLFDGAMIDEVVEAIRVAQVSSHVEYKRRVGYHGRVTIAKTVLDAICEGLGIPTSIDLLMDQHTRVLPPGGGDPDCDLCYPENHTGCTRKPYNGAAGHMITGTHRRCDRHSQQVTP